MGRGKRVVTPVKKLIVKAVTEGKSQREAARTYGVSQKAVCNLMKRFRQDKTLASKPIPGRPRKTTERLDRSLIQLSKADPTKTAVDLNLEMKQTYGLNVSVSTIKRRLRHANLFGRRPAKKPLVSLKNRKARQEFAKVHKDWNQQQWSKVLFTDESKFMMFGSDGIKYVRRPLNARFNSKYLLPTVKHGGGNIMVWGAFSRDGVGPIHRIDGIMDQVMYADIMKKIMLPHGKDKMPRGWILQQDNDPKHTAKSVQAFFTKNKIRVLPWPSQSPDLNPIEHLWEYVGRKLTGFKPSKKDDLFVKIKEIWQNVPLDYCIKLVDSMSARCTAVIKNKGYPTKY